jgi:CheY-like chemotaxis protein
MKPLLALAEDDELLRDTLSDALERDGWQVLALEDGYELADYLEFALKGKQPSLVLTDVRMPGLSGLEVVERARARGIVCPIVVMTSWPDPKLSERAKALGRTLLIPKPAELDVLLTSLRDAVNDAHMRS